ncbi:MAG: Holliday junction branch migration protein RuvA [Microcoleaceae cyanobacterium]
MIGYLKGKVIEIQRGNNSKVTLILDVNQIGYEIQIVPRAVGDLPEPGEMVQVFTHVQLREEQLALYGFLSSAERELFRQLVSVSGIGNQLGLALLDTLGLQNLVQAIVSSNTRILSKTPGVGTKTAERISLELKTKLAEWRQQAGLSQTLTPHLTPEIQEEVEMTLLALGYSGSEVMKALQALSQDRQLTQNTPTEEWIRSGISWLADHAT